jgi:hypothetical protein
MIARQSIKGSSRIAAIVPGALTSVQPDKRQDGHDHNDQTDKIDQPVHLVAFANPHVLNVPGPSAFQPTDAARDMS